jgi:sugar-specific transcriptional regulator TrmB
MSYSQEGFDNDIILSGMNQREPNFDSMELSRQNILDSEKEKDLELEKLRRSLDACEHLRRVRQEVEDWDYDTSCAEGFALQRDTLKEIIKEARKELEMITPISSKIRDLFDHAKKALEILNKVEDKQWQKKDM